MIMHECGVERVSMSVELYIYNEGSEGEREQEKECLSVATCDVQNKKQNCSDPFETYDSDKILSMDWFKKSFLADRSALGNRDWMASLAVFFVTVIRSCVLR